MAPNVESLIAVLNSTAPPPATNCLSMVGSLELPLIARLATALQSSSFAGGIRLEGECRVYISIEVYAPSRYCSVFTNERCGLRVRATQLRSSAIGRSSDGQQGTQRHLPSWYGSTGLITPRSPSFARFRWRMLVS